MWKSVLCCAVSLSVMSDSLWPDDCCRPVSFVHGILQARILVWVAMHSSRGYSQPRDWTQVSCFVGKFFTNWSTREALRVFCLVKTPFWSTFAVIELQKFTRMSYLVAVKSLNEIKSDLAWYCMEASLAGTGPCFLKVNLLSTVYWCSPKSQWFSDNRIFLPLDYPETIQFIF